MKKYDLGKIKLNKKIFANKGITLTSMVIMIVIFLILLGISGSAILKNIGIINTTKNTKKQLEIVTITGVVSDEIIAKEIETDSTITASQVVEILEKYGTVQYEEDGITIKGIVTEEGTQISMQELYDEEIVY